MGTSKPNSHFTIDGEDMEDNVVLNVRNEEEEVRDRLLNVAGDSTLMDDIRKGKKELRDLDSSKNKKVAKRLWDLAVGEKWYLIFGTISLFIASVTILAVPLLVGRIVDATFTEKSDQRAQLRTTVVEMIIIVTISSIFTGLRGYLYNTAGERVVTRLRSQLFGAIAIQDIAFFDETKSGELVNRLASDCTVLQNTVTVNISMGLRSIISLISSIFLLFFISWKMTLVILCFVPPLVIAAVIFGRWLKKISKDYQEALAKSSDIAVEAFTNIRTVRNFAQEEFEIKTYDSAVNTTFQLAKTRSKAYGLMMGLGTFIANLAVGAVLWYGGSLVIDGTFSPGDLTSFIIYSVSMATSIGTVTSLYSDFMKAIGSSERVFELLDREPKVHWKGGRGLNKIKGELKMENVRFSYPSRPDIEVLRGINLTLDPGKIIALVGPSGGGKTTIVSLLEMFYYPNSGRITLDGYNLRDLDPQNFRKYIGVVSQEPMLFGTTIAKNIAYGIPDVPIEKIIEYSKMANAHDFISTFPDQYDTLVGERGLRLSGGQKQRVAIARALLLDPSILLLDEATSALDAESEYLVQDALDKLMKGRTVLVIAHRLSTVKNADLVCVVDKGVIIESGKHDELLEKGGLYTLLVQRQLQNN